MVHFSNTNNPIDFPKQEKIEYDFDTLDQVVRKWAVQSLFEKDLENYEELQQQYR